MQLNFTQSPARLISGFEHRTLLTQQNRAQQPACGLSLKIKLRVSAFLVLSKDSFHQTTLTHLHLCLSRPAVPSGRADMSCWEGEKRTGCGTLCLPLISCSFPEDRGMSPLS